MSFKEKLEKAFKNKIGDFTGVQWKDLDHKKVYMAGGGLVLLIALVVALLMGGIEGKDNKEQKPGSEQTQIEVTPEVTEEVVEDALKTDAFPEINALVEKYFQGLSSGDTAMVAETVDVLTDEEKQVIERKKDYIEAYNNVVCYTKSGLEEDSYVVFASYEMKIYNIETAAPGIMALYVCKGDDGSYYIFNGETPEELENYVLELAAEEEVRAVISEVDARYQKLVKEDEDLKKFSETMLQSQKDEQPGEEPEAPVDENDSQATAGEPKNTVVTDNVRLREERSTESAVLETLASGTGVKVLMNYADGWSKIEYNDMTGYCKTEFLENTEGVPTENVQQEQPKEEQPEEEQPKEEPETPADENDSQATAGEPKNTVVTDNVRLREGRSTDSTMLETLASGTGVKVLMNYADGWSKITYNDMTGYCKTEFLENTEGVPTENAQQEQPKEEQPKEEQPKEEPETPVDENDSQATAGEPKNTVVTDNVRLREGRSTDSTMLETLASGTGVKVLMNYADGWSKITYNDMTGYCKTEFLEDTKGVPTENAQQEQPEENTEAETTETETTETETTETETTETETTTEVTPVNKQMQFKEAVRIREGRSADTKRLTNAYEKELVMVIENYSDGWSKVNYNDIVGYCKTEFLEPAK